MGEGNEEREEKGIDSKMEILKIKASCDKIFYVISRIVVSFIKTEFQLFLNEFLI